MERAGSSRLINENRFDHIFFTGGPGVGKIIMAAAAKHLTPVCLELGGKNPCYVEDGADVDYTACRLMQGKHFNCGQICITADYILCSPEMQDKLIKACKKWLGQFYENKSSFESDHYCRIISEGHTNRIVNLINHNKVAIGGNYNKGEKFIEITVLRDVSPDDKIMQEEIFGPVLPILPIAKNIDHAIKFIQDTGEKPLAAYIFTENDKSAEKFLNTTTSGGACVNDLMMHYTCHSLPFGGVGQSGMGRYHGKYSFETFTHEKAIFKQTALGKPTASLMIPPYNKQAWRLGLLIKMFHGPPFDVQKAGKWMKFLLEIGVYAALGFFLYQRYYGSAV